MNQQKNKKRIWSILLIATSMLFLIMEKVQAQSSENYHVKKSAIDQGGAPSQSANYKTIDAVGQSSAIGTASSENYFVSSGILGGYESGLTAVDKNVSMVIPEKFKLLQNFPNPFNPVTHIEYHLPHAADVELTIYDIRGHVVRQLVRGTISAGYHTTLWDSKNMAGKIVASGIYFYRIEIKTNKARQQSYLDIKKMILMK